MKKIFTLLFTVGSITAAVAQSHNGSYSRNDNHIDDRRYEASYSVTARERDEQIARVNRQFDAEVRKVQFDGYLRQNQKRKQIEKLQFQRSQQINAINARFADRRNKYSSPYAYGRH